MSSPLTIRVNEQPRTIRSAPDTPLLYVLTDELRLQGPRYDAASLKCGSCSVLVDGVGPCESRARAAARCAIIVTTMSHLTDRCRVFRQLHQSGCFVIPNPWDLGSARLLAQLGFPALATTSSGFAWSLGRPDHRVSLEEALAQLRSIAHGHA